MLLHSCVSFNINYFSLKIQFMSMLHNFFKKFIITSNKHLLTLY